jgi:hypothetical protein
MHCHDGFLRIDSEVNGSSTLQGAVPFDAAAHRWWRLRFQYGNVIVETTDGISGWSDTARFPAPFSIAAV